MKQTSSLTRNLTAAQDVNADAPAFNAEKTLYRLYTERIPDLDVTPIIGRYFKGATILHGVGLDARTTGASENAIVIEIVSSKPDSLQRIADLAGDLRVAGHQVSVLVTVQPVRTFEITSPTINLRSKAQAHRLAGLDGL